jgi:hypothetical protein
MDLNESRKHNRINFIIKWLTVKHGYYLLLIIYECINRHLPLNALTVNCKSLALFFLLAQGTYLAFNKYKAAFVMK